MAAEEWQGHDPRTGRQVPTGTRSVVDDLAAELVAEDDLLGRAADALIATPGGDIGPVVAAVLGVEVRAADATAQDAQANLSLGRDWLGELVDPQCIVLADNGPHGRRAHRGVVVSSAGSFGPEYTSKNRLVMAVGIANYPALGGESMGGIRTVVCC